MNEVVETKGASKPTPAGTTDVEEHQSDSAAEADAKADSDKKLAELKERTHPFD